MIRLLIAPVLVSWLGGAEPVAEPPAAPSAPSVTTIPLQPASTPRPALKYRLIPERYGLIPGNAALFYHRANLLIAQRKQVDQSGPKAWAGHAKLSVEEQIIEWTKLPIADLPRDEVRGVLDRFTSVIREIEAGARRDHCDWEFARRDEGFELLLPEIQESRTLCRLIELQARLAIAEGRLDHALGSIQTGMVLARHVADGPTLIQTLIGDAIAGQMIGCLEILVGTPGAPSLFWALADRPRPMIDLRSAFEGERHLFEKEFPGLVELDRGIWSVDQAHQFVESLQAELFNLFGGEAIPGFDVTVPSLSPTFRRLALAGLFAKVEPEARRALLRDGRSASEVDAMPVVQVAMLHVYHRFQERRDAMYKWANVPYFASAGRFQPEDLSVEEKQANPILAILSTLDVGIEPSKSAAMRVDRRLDALQVVEAIRLDATRHDGHLPASLDAIKDLPILLDPATGKSFEYRVEGTSATVSAPSLAEAQRQPGFAIEIRLVPPSR